MRRNGNAMDESTNNLQQKVQQIVNDQLKATQLQIYQNMIIPGQIKPRHLVAGDNPPGTLYTSNGTDFTQLAPGTNGQVLTIAAGLPSYATPASPPSQVFTQVKNQAIAVNTTYTSGLTIQSGWGYVTGTGSPVLLGSVTYPTAYTTLLMPPVLTLLGGKNGGGVPTAIADFTTDWGVTQAIIAVSPSTTGFAVYNYIATLAAGQYNGFSWMTIGII